jgi:hypothetical protein
LADLLTLLLRADQDLAVRTPSRARSNDEIDAGMSDRDLHFNDLRDTAATKFYIAGFTMREIAETLAWEEESVEKIIRRYVGCSAALKARIRKLQIRE